MTTEHLIKIIQEKNPTLTQEQLLERLQAEKARTGGLLGDETLLRLIAAKYGVEVQNNGISNNGNLSSSRLFAGLNDVTVAGRLVGVSEVRAFEGERPGKFAALLIIDHDGVLRAILWNEKAELIEKGELKVGQDVRLLHGYTRQDRSGKVELHLGGKSKVEIETKEKAGEYPAVGKFATSIALLNPNSGAVNLSGTVKEVFRKTIFMRSDSTEGVVMRFVLGDNSGEVTAVAWDEKATLLEKNLQPNMRLHLLYAKVKESRNGSLEVHVDSSCFASIEA
jgi:ssDNA-binding replication factor A large subunit